MSQEYDKRIQVSKPNGDYFVKKDGKWGLVNPNGDYVIPPTYDAIKAELDGYLVEDNNKFGFFDRFGKQIYEPTFDALYINGLVAGDEIFEGGSTGHPGSKGNNFAIVIKNENYGVIDFQGNVIINIDCEFISYKDEFFGVVRGGKFGVYNLKGQLYQEIDLTSPKGHFFATQTEVAIR